MKKNREAELLGRTGAPGSTSSHSWTHKLILDADGGVRPILANLILFLREHPTWKGVPAFDEFHLRVTIRKRPYWSDERPGTPWVDQRLQDHDETLVRVWFQHEDIVAAQGDIGRAIQAAARFNCFNPPRDYLSSLIYDGTLRIDTWLIDYLGASDTPYTRAIGPRILISAVARILAQAAKSTPCPFSRGRRVS